MMSNPYIPDQLHHMSKKELLEFAQTAHEENVKLARIKSEWERVFSPIEEYCKENNLTPLGKSYTKSLVDSHASLREQLAKANECNEKHEEKTAALLIQLAKANASTASLEFELANANKRMKELEKKLEPDMFWNSDGDMSFDSIEELFDYYGDCHEGGKLKMDCRMAVSLPDKSYSGVYDADNNEWVITEQLRKEQE